MRVEIEKAEVKEALRGEDTAQVVLGCDLVFDETVRG